MLKILLINKNSDFFSYLASQKQGVPGSLITPNPQIADLARSRFESSLSIESITISKYIKDELNQLCFDLLDNYKGKSELLLLLGAIWNKVANKDFAEFKKAFNLLTEFRSFSMSDHILETVLEHYDEETGRNVIWLHRFLNELDIVDEHKSYFQLAEVLRDGDLPPDYEIEKDIYFYGFDFMTGSQVDLIKAVSIRNDVIIPFYKESFETAQNLDWIKWLEDGNSAIEDISNESIRELNASLITYPKNYLGQTILSCSQQEEIDIVLGAKKITEECYLEVPYASSKVKVGINLVENELSQLLSDLGEKFNLPIDNESVRNYLKNRITDYTKDNKFLNIKAVLIFLTKLNEWESLADENITLDDFTLAVLKESLQLDLPRVNMANLSQRENLASIYSLNEVVKLEDKDVLMAISSNHGNLKGSNAVYSDQVEKYLTSIGPIRRSELELSVLEAKIKEFISNNNVTILLENGIEEHDIAWSSILGKLCLKNIEITNDEKVKNSKVDLNDFLINFESLEKISASKLQKYIECPKKYYLSYIRKIMPQIKDVDSIDVLDLGQLEHKVIELYMKSNKTFDEIIHKELVESTLLNFCCERNVTELEIDECRIEILAYTSDILVKLFVFQNEFKLNWELEKSFKVEKNKILFNGSIDGFASNGLHTIVLDFKRSQRVFPSYKTILEFEKVQLWFYLNSLVAQKAIELDKDILFGYIDLSDIKNSRFFTNSKEMMSILKKKIGFSLVKHIDDFVAFFETYQEFEGEAIKRLTSDKKFTPKPLNEDSCTYCPVNNICDRGLN